MLELNIPQPLEADIHYNIYSSIGRHIKIRYNYIKLEKKLGFHSWCHHVNLSICGVSFVYTYNVETQSLSHEDNFRELFCALGEYIIDNDLYTRPKIPPSRRTGRST